MSIQKEQKLLAPGKKSGVVSKRNVGLGILLILPMFVAIFAAFANSRTNLQSKAEAIEERTVLFDQFRSERLQEATDNARMSAVAYQNKHAAGSDRFPWLGKMPVTGDGYFVYFNIATRTFEGVVFDASNANTELIKEEAIAYMNDLELPVLDYSISWKLVY